MATRDPHSMTIRAHLSMLAICAVLPVFAFAGLVSVTLVEQEQRTFERGVIERARALMTAIDAQLRGSIATLQALSASRSLADDDLRAFHESAVRLLGSQPDWYDITLASPGGKNLVDMREPFDAPLADVFDWPSAQRSLETQSPVIGNVAKPGSASPPIVPIHLPVIRDGSIRYILIAQVRPESFATLIADQHLPNDWCLVSSTEMATLSRACPRAAPASRRRSTFAPRAHARSKAGFAAAQPKARTRSPRFSARRSATGRSASLFRRISFSAPHGKRHG